MSETSNRPKICYKAAVMRSAPTSASWFILQERPEGDEIASICISQAWYNGRYPVAAKSIKTLELHYPMIISDIHYLYLKTTVFCFADPQDM